MTIKSESKYWDTTWDGRIGKNGSIRMNGEKIKIVINSLRQRIEFIGREKFEIGCGTGTMWTGIDLAESAVKQAKKFGLNAEVADIYEYTSDKKFQVFLMLESLEHHEHHDLLADKIRELASEKGYSIFGNIPLYSCDLHEEGGYERPMDIHILCAFLQNAGCKQFTHKVFGAYGYPYMMFQGWSEQKVGK